MSHMSAGILPAGLPGGDPGGEGEALSTPGSVPQTDVWSPSSDDDYRDGFPLHTTPVPMQLTTKNSRDPDFPGQALLSDNEMDCARGQSPGKL